MKKLKSLTVLVLVLCLAVTCFAGCGGEKEQGIVQEVTGVFNDCLMLEQIGLVDIANFSVYGGGLVYKDSDTKKYGIMSVEGLVDSGAIYDYVKEKGTYFAVLKTRAAHVGDIDGVNKFALVTGDGRQIVGPYYAGYEINGDYVVAYTATARADDGCVMINGSEAFDYATKCLKAIISEI